MKKKAICMLAVMIAALGINVTPHSVTNAATKVVAFPGAEGGGKYATGGRGGSVYYVTNLNDSGAGSFRDAVSKPNRIVLFKVGGTIELKSDVPIQSNITIAGQTAPGGAGITLKNYKVGLCGSNIIMRYISSRPGERKLNKDYDALGGSNGSNSIVDHCSFGWANDEQWGLYSNNINATTQWSVIGPSNSFSYHSKGIHGFGVMFGKGNHSMHHNMIVHNVSRNFRGKVEGTYTADFVNNVIYNWGYETAYGTIGHLNYVGNYLKMGQGTTGGRHYIDIDSTTKPENFGMYLTKNKLVNINGSDYGTLCSNNWSGVIYGKSNGRNESNIKSNTAFKMMVNGEDVSVANKAESADNAYSNVLTYAGAGINANSRPEIDKQVMNEAKTGTGNFVGARPYSEANESQKATIDKMKIQCGVTFNYPKAITEGAAKDSDGDGMPDDWEIARGLNPYSIKGKDGSLEANGDYCGKGYTNIEYYLNDLTVNSFPKGTVTISPVIKTNTDNAGNVTPSTKVATVDYGSYYRIKNVNSGKYLNVFNSSSRTKLTQTSNLSDNSIWQVAISKDGYIKLANQSSSSNMMVIDVPAASKENGVQLQIWGSSVGDHQELKLKDNGDGTFGILTKISGDTKALDVYGYSKDEGANIIQYNYVASNNQKWIFEKVNYNKPIVNGGIYILRNVNSNCYLDVVNGEDVNGTNVRQWTGNGEEAQKFKVVSTGDGYYKFISQVGSKTRVLDVNGNKATDGQNISLYEDRGTDNQKFNLIDKGNDTYIISTKVSSGKSVIEVKNASKTKGANVQQWTSNNNNCQRWRFERVG